MPARGSDSRDRAGEFNGVVAAVASETIASVLGQTVWEAYARYLRSTIGLAVDDIPAHLGRVFNSLRDSFGVGGDVLARRIVKSLYAKYGIELTITEGRPLEDYVEELRTRFMKGHLPNSDVKRSDSKRGESLES